MRSCEFVGCGRKLAVFNQNDVVYKTYWQAEIDNARRLCLELKKSHTTTSTTPAPPTPAAKRGPKLVELAGLPNVDLFHKLV